MAQDDSAGPGPALPDEQRASEPERSVEADLAQRNRAAELDDQAADDRDTEAEVADTAANARDFAAMRRDVDADREMVGEPLTTSARRAQRDREAAALDRTSAADDRGRSREDRKAAKEGRTRASGDRAAAMEGVAYLRDLLDEADANADDMLVVGRAQGMLMLQNDIDAGEALLAVAMRAARERKNLQSAALEIVDEDSA